MKLAGRAFCSGAIAEHGYYSVHQKRPEIFTWKYTETLGTSQPEEISHRNHSPAEKRAYTKEESSTSHSLTFSLASVLPPLEPPKPTAVVLELEKLFYVVCVHGLLKWSF